MLIQLIQDEAQFRARRETCHDASHSVCMEYFCQQRERQEVGGEAREQTSTRTEMNSLSKLYTSLLLRIVLLAS